MPALTERAQEAVPIAGIERNDRAAGRIEADHVASHERRLRRACRERNQGNCGSRRQQAMDKAWNPDHVRILKPGGEQQVKDLPPNSSPKSSRIDPSGRPDSERLHGGGIAASRRAKTNRDTVPCPAALVSGIPLRYCSEPQNWKAIESSSSRSIRNPWRAASCRKLSGSRRALEVIECRFTVRFAGCTGERTALIIGLS